MPPHLLTLPLGIRHQIYAYLLVTAPSRLYAYPWLSNPPQPIASSANRIPTTDLLLVNQQIHTEALLVLYSLNTIAFEHPEQLAAFVFSVPAASQAHIRSIELVLSAAQAGAVECPTRRVRAEVAAARCRNRSAVDVVGDGAMRHAGVDQAGFCRAAGVGVSGDGW